MAEAIRAIFHDGHLQLLDAVNLKEGQEVQLVILSEKEKLHAILGDLVLEVGEIPAENLNEADLLKEIAQDFRGQLPLSQTIIEERQALPE